MLNTCKQSGEIISLAGIVFSARPDIKKPLGYRVRLSAVCRLFRPEHSLAFFMAGCKGLKIARPITKQKHTERFSPPRPDRRNTGSIGPSLPERQPKGLINVLLFTLNYCSSVSASHQLAFLRAGN